MGTETVSDIYQIAQLIYETKKIDRLRLFIMTNAIAPADYDPDNSEMPSGTTVEYHIRDARRIMQQDNIMRGKVPVVVDFDAEYNSPLPCIMMPDVSESVNCYLAIIPGTVLADIYHKYHQQILEKNVRTFLQFKGHRTKVSVIRLLDTDLQQPSSEREICLVILSLTCSSPTITASPQLRQKWL